MPKRVKITDISIKASIGLSDWAGFSSDCYCCNDACKHWVQTDRAGCGVGGYSYVSHCDDSITIEPEYFIEQEKIRTEQFNQEYAAKNMGAGI